MPGQGKKPSKPETIAFSQAIEEELASVRKSRRLLANDSRFSTLHGVILFGCILINALFLLIRRDYFALFIAASFYLNMFYFISLLIPTSRESALIRRGDIGKSRAWLQEMGLMGGTTRFTRLFLNAFFINSRSLSLGIGMIFTIDILFILVDYFLKQVSFWGAVIVISQCAAIALFYLLIWKIEPFSTAFVRNVEVVKTRLSLFNVPQHLISALFMVGFAFGVILILITIILLPGMTVAAFLDESGLEALGHLVGLIVILIISQYFVIRYIHGISSRRIAERLLDYKEAMLQELVHERTDGTRDPGRNPAGITALLESRLYQVRQHTLLGSFPVCVVDLDLSVMLDSTTMTAIQGYIREKE
jgi:hypothetical protein